jgi:hypothetical protein
MNRAVVLACCLAALLGTASPALAQGAAPSAQWGIALGVAPAWTVPGGDGPLAKLAQASLESADLGYTIDGVDLRVGIIRGRRGHGNWGIALVRRVFKNGSIQGAIVTECILEISCFVRGTEYHYQDAALTGVEASRFVPFGTIRNAVQIGVDLAAGTGWYRHTVERREATNEFTEGNTEATPGFRSELVPASELSKFHPSLLGRAELAVAVLMSPKLNLRVSGGVNYPGASVGSVSVAYFFGSN